MSSQWPDRESGRPSEPEGRRFNRRTALALGAGAAAVGLGASFLRPTGLPAPGLDQADLVNVRDARFGAAGDGRTNDREAIQRAIDEAADGDGIVYFPAGTYLVDGEGPNLLRLRANLRLLGEGRHVATITTVDRFDDFRRLFLLENDSRALIESIGLKMPTEFSRPPDQSVVLTGIQTDREAIELTCNDVYFRNLTYGIQAWAGSKTVINCDRCLFSSEDVSSDYSSFGIHHPGSSGAAVIVTGCSFDKLGSAVSPNLVHCLYLYNSVSLYASGCRFTNHIDGRYIQWFGDDYRDEGPATYAIIEGCYFGPQTVPNTGIHTCPTRDTEVVACHFATQRNSVDVKGNCRIESCTFEADSGNSYSQVSFNPFEASDAEISVSKCSFHGRCFADIFLSARQHSLKLKVSGSTFESEAKHHIVTGQGVELVSIRDSTFNAARGPAIELRDPKPAEIEIRGNSTVR